MKPTLSSIERRIAGLYITATIGSSGIRGRMNELELLGYFESTHHISPTL